MFDKYLEPPRVERPILPAQAVQVSVHSAGTPSSTTIDKDAPSPRKSKKHTHKPKTENTNLEVLHTLHMDLCGLMRGQTINEKKYILVIIDDYSRFTWVKFLRSKDETLEVVIKFIQQIQVGLNKNVRYVRTDNGTEFVNHTLTEYYERIDIFHQKTIPKTPQQNGVVKRRNRTLVEAAKTMLIFSKAPMFLWAVVVATACYTQNRSLIHTRHHKTPYELVHNKKPDLTFFKVLVLFVIIQTTAKTLESFNQQLILEYLAFTASSTIPSIYIQQFWDTVQYDKKAGCYGCQLDEQWFVLTKDTLREALQIAPVNNNQAFITPPSSDVLINFVNELGYPKHFSITGDILFIPRRGKFNQASLNLLSNEVMANVNVLGPRVLDVIATQSNGTRIITIQGNLVEVKAIVSDQFITKELSTSGCTSSCVLTTCMICICIGQPVLGYLKFNAKGTTREVFRMPIPGSLITADIQKASYYQEYLANVAKHRRYLAGETGSDPDSPASKPTKPARKPKSIAPKAPPRPSISTPVTSVQPAPTSAPAKPQEKKRKQTTETSDKPPKAKKSKYGIIGKKRTLKSVAASKAEDAPTKEPQVAAEDADLQKALEESMKTIYVVPQGPLPPVVIREPESGKYQPLPEVPRKGKAKVTKEQVAHDLLSLQSPRGRALRINTYSKGVPPYLLDPPDMMNHHMLRLDSLKERNLKRLCLGLMREVKVKARLDQTLAGPDPGNAGANVQSIPSLVIHAGSDLEHMDLDVADVSPQPSMEQLDEGFTTTAYPKQFKATTTKTTTTTTTTLPPPPAQQKSTAEDMMMKHIGELEHIMANLIQEKKGLEERLDSHGARLYTLEQLDIPHQVSKAELVQDLAEARKKKKKSRESPKTPPRSPPHQPPPPPAGPSGASGAPRPSRSSQVPPPPSSTNQENLEIDEEMGPDEQAQSSDEEDIGKPAWSIPSSDALTDDIATFTDWFCKRRGITELKPQDLEGPAFEIVKVFHPDVIHLQYQIEECHMLLADSVDDPILRHNVSKPLPLGGPPGQVKIQSDFFFNKDLEYLRYSSKGSRPTLSISKMKAAYYPDAGLEQMVPDQ
nr:putative ribonuclease H-like domain-containing protein [Tanacetum cinerariifolium]